MIIAMMEAPGKKDQIYLLMYEKDMAEMLYMLLTGSEYSSQFKEKVLKVGHNVLFSNHFGGYFDFTRIDLVCDVAFEF